MSETYHTHTHTRSYLFAFLPTCPGHRSPHASFSKWHAPVNIGPQLTLLQDMKPLLQNFIYYEKFIFVFNLLVNSHNAPDVAAVCLPLALPALCSSFYYRKRHGLLHLVVGRFVL